MKIIRATADVSPPERPLEAMFDDRTKKRRVTGPVAFDLKCADGRLTGSARFRQTDFRMKPYSALFGTLKVADEIEVAVDVQIPTESA